MTREELISQLQAAGADMSAVSDEVPDAILAQLLAALQAAKAPEKQAAKAPEKPVEASDKTSEPAATATKPAPAASSVTVKFSETPEYAAMLKRIEAAEARSEAALKENREARAAARRAEVLEFCDAQLKAGRLLPRDLDNKNPISIVRVLCGLSDAELAKAKDEIAARPKQYDFADRIPDGTATTEAEYKAVMNATPMRRAVAERVEAARKAGLIR